MRWKLDIITDENCYTLTKEGDTNPWEIKLEILDDFEPDEFVWFDGDEGMCMIPKKCIKGLAVATERRSWMLKL